MSEGNSHKHLLFFPTAFNALDELGGGELSITALQRRLTPKSAASWRSYSHVMKVIRSLAAIGFARSRSAGKRRLYRLTVRGERARSAIKEYARLVEGGR
jgi:hypothetical protein